MNVSGGDTATRAAWQASRQRRLSARRLASDRQRRENTGKTREQRQTPLAVMVVPVSYNDAWRPGKGRHE
jgi:hypothetical protein